jgi:succinyl-CoA synthetase alpha subunit
VPGVVEECLEKGVRGLVVITAGFGETGPEGARIEAGIRDRVRAAGVRMIGPNCMGVINTDPEVRLNATFAPTPARPGSIGFVSQSGALGVAILNVASDLGVGLTQFVSMGNKADVSGNDLLEYWEDDPSTRVIAMYLESFGNPRRFTEIAKRVGRKKPILVVKSGRTTEGARAASSHTGAIAGADVTVSPSSSSAASSGRTPSRSSSTWRWPSTAARCPGGTGWRSSPTPAARGSWPPTPASTWGSRSRSSRTPRGRRSGASCPPRPRWGTRWT